MDFDLALELLKSKGYRILHKEGKSKVSLSKDKNGYDLIIMPDDPKYSIVIIGLDENNVIYLRDKLNDLLAEKKDGIK